MTRRPHNLARMGAGLTVQAVIEQIPDWEIAGYLEYGSNIGLRAPHEVPIALPR